MRDFVFVTERLGFALWTADDLAFMQGIFGDPVVTKFEGGDWTAQQIRDRLDSEIANQALYGVQYWPVYLLETGEHAGCCGLRPHDLEHGVWEIGCQLRRAFWSRKLGREAFAKVIDHAFRTLDVKALYAGHHPENHPSRRLLEHSGITHTHDEVFPLTGLMEPCYRLEREDYLMRRSNESRQNR